MFKPSSKALSQILGENWKNEAKARFENDILGKAVDALREFDGQKLDDFEFKTEKNGMRFHCDAFFDDGDCVPNWFQIDVLFDFVKNENAEKLHEAWGRGGWSHVVGLSSHFRYWWADGDAQIHFWDQMPLDKPLDLAEASMFLKKSQGHFEKLLDWVETEERED